MNGRAIFVSIYFAMLPSNLFSDNLNQKPLSYISIGYNQETAFSFHAIGTFKQLRYAAGIVYILTETVNASIAVIRTTILFFLHSMAISQQKLFPFLNWIPRTHFLRAELQSLLELVFIGDLRV